MSALKRKLHKNSKGFTLAEVMITVAILIVLIAVAAPNVVKYQKSLKQMEVNRTAEEIYLAVQNTLTDYKASGTFDAVVKEAEAFKVNQPADYPGTLPEGFQTYRVSNSDEFYKKYLHSLGLSAISGKYYIEFFDKSCEAYSVIYAEDASRIDPSKLNTTAYRDGKTEGVGFYGGKPATLPDDYYETDTVVLNISSVDDGNELVLRLSMPKKSDFVALECAFSLNLTDGKTAKTISLGGMDDDKKASGDDCVKEVKLDTINGKHFMELCPEFANGKPITVTADVTVKKGDKVLTLDTKNSNYKTSFNPLFNFATTDSTIYVSNARHLNNLNSEYFNPADDFSPSKIEQLTTIDFSGVTGYKPVSMETPVDYNGNNLAIDNLNSMLFAEHSKNFSNVIITNPAISDTSGSNVGTLVGTQTGGTISNCRTFVTDVANYKAKTVEGSGQYTGGLVGSASGTTVLSSFAAVNVSGKSIGEDKGTGGFAGCLTNCPQIKQCYSSGEVTGNNSCSGGFAAFISGTSLSSCYTTSDVSTEHVEAGGFACEIAGSGKLEYCYAFGRLIDASLEYLEYQEYADEDTAQPHIYGGFALSSDPDTDSCSFMCRGENVYTDANGKKYTSNNGYNEFVDDSCGNGYDYLWLTDPAPTRRAIGYAGTLRNAPVNGFEGHKEIFPFDIEGFDSSIPHYGNWPHNYVISDRITGTGRHQYICAICGNTYDLPHHDMDGLCDICDEVYG